ncbi:MAG: trypsin-like peptidase domain-containing protein [Actinomycetota bacterium]|nr:trypsin-like peptidase domain-containing protein [Actinomycetota bacterium]
MDNGPERPSQPPDFEPIAGRPDVDVVGHDTPADVVRPAAPLPPPRSWSADEEGPGSPAGSVRPPDSTGVVTVSSLSSPSRRRGVLTTFMAALVGAALGTASTLVLTRAGPAALPETTRAPVVESGGGDQGSVVPAVAEAVKPSVVRVDRPEIAGSRGVPESGLGSGVIYRSDGYVITNHHVVEGADEVHVKYASGESESARVAGRDPLTDIAVLKVERRGLPAINVRREPVVVGELAIAIGSPFGLDATVTAGVVSALNRSIEAPIRNGVISIPNVIQTDAAINPGNSGGALVDRNGRLIGINSAILTTTGGVLGGSPGNVGVGFAISAEDAVAVADKLIEQGFARHARLGIRAGDLTPSVARQFGIEVTEGVLVSDVEAGGPAAGAGLRSGDVIIAAGGEPVASMAKLTSAIRAREPGDPLKLTILRAGQRMELEAVLGEWRG